MSDSKRGGRNTQKQKEETGSRVKGKKALLTRVAQETKRTQKRKRGRREKSERPEAENQKRTRKMVDSQKRVITERAE